MLSNCREANGVPWRPCPSVRGAHTPELCSLPLWKEILLCKFVVFLFLAGENKGFFQCSIPWKLDQLKRLENDEEMNICFVPKLKCAAVQGLSMGLWF